MRWLDATVLRLRTALRRDRANRDLDAEIAFYLEQEVEKNLARGLGPEEARRQARLAFGSLDAAKDDCRNAWGFQAVENLSRDVRHGLRGLSRAPGFTTMVLVTLGVGIGATTLVFAVAWALWLRPLPYPDAERLVAVEAVREQGPPADVVRHPSFVAWRDEATTLDAVAAFAFSSRDQNLTLRGEPERVVTLMVTAGFFPLLTSEPFAAGRGFVAADEQLGAEAVVVLGHEFWMRRFGGDPSLVGETVNMDGRPRVVVGVAPAGFTFPGRERVDVYIPHSFPPVVSDDGRQVFMVLVHVIGRLAPGQSVESAEAELEVVRRRSAATFYSAPRLSSAASLMTRDALRVRPLHDQLVGDVRGRVWLLSGAIALLLLIACANVANLQVIRTLGRQRELAVRLTMGATRRRVAAQLLTETLVLGGLAAAVALAALGLGMGGMRALIADIALFADTIGLDGATLGFAVAVVVLMCLVSVGAALAWLPRFLHRAAAGLQSGAAVPRRRLQGALLGGQVALTLVLLVSAGLLLTSLTRLTATDTGFDPRYLLTFRAVSHLHEMPQQAAFVDGILERVGALPGVESVAMTDRLPFETTPTSEIGTSLRFIGRDAADEEPPRVLGDTVSPDFVATLGMRLEAGRDLTARDGADAPPVVIVNRAFARRFFPGEPDARILDRPRLEMPVRSFNRGGPPIAREGVSIAGIVADARTVGLADEPAPHVFRPYAQFFWGVPGFLVRTSADPLALAPAIRAELGNLYADVPLFDMTTVEDRVAQSVGSERLNTLVAGAFAALALLLAAVGVYSIAAHVAAQRRYELGVRLALGATARQLVTLVVRQALRPVLVGALLGVGAAFASGRVLDSLLFEIGPADPGSFGAATVLLLGIALLASYAPARRASRADPFVTLKSE